MSLELKLIAIGCAGGVIPDLIRFAKARYDATIADYFKHWNFWLGLVVLVALGGIAAALGEPTTTMQARSRLAMPRRSFSQDRRRAARQAH
jgi:hypothetical protein